MAQTVAGFPAAAVRAGLRKAMSVGMPVEPARWPEFVRTVPAVAGNVDANGVPWDPTATPAPPAVTSHRPLCAIEWTTQPLETTEHFGSRDPQTIFITLLDEEYALVEGFDYVNVYSGKVAEPVKFFYRKVADQPNLDTVGVWRIECSTEDTL